MLKGPNFPRDGSVVLAKSFLEKYERTRPKSAVSFTLRKLGKNANFHDERAPT